MIIFPKIYIYGKTIQKKINIDLNIDLYFT